ncbi:MAG: hypothetical protein WEA99_01585 [Brumimicrobium sp.]
MKQTRYIFPLLLLLFSSCQTKTTKERVFDLEAKETPSLKNDEIELISDLIEELVQPEPPIPLPPIPDSTETQKEHNKRYEKREKQLQKRYDTTIFTFYLDKTLMVPKDLYRETRTKSDTAYFGLSKLLMTDTLSPRKIDLGKIKTNQFKLVESFPEDWSKWGYEFMGIAKFSRISFNDDYTRAFFFFEFKCGSLCGGGHSILAEKKGGKWEIVRREMIWVS